MKTITVSKISIETYNQLIDAGYKVKFEISTSRPVPAKEVVLRLKPEFKKRVHFGVGEMAVYSAPNVVTWYST